VSPTAPSGSNEPSGAPRALPRDRAPFSIDRIDRNGDGLHAHLTPAGGDPRRDGSWVAVGGSPAPGWTVIGIDEAQVTLMTPALNLVQVRAD
jgi:hypothetical protein